MNNQGTSHTEVIIISATVVVIVLVAAYFYFSTDRSAPEMQEAKNAQPVQAALSQSGSLPTNAELTKQYQESVQDIVKGYSSDSLNIGTAHALYTDIAEELLALTVPPSLQQFHFDLVVAFDKLAQATDPEVDSSMSEINAIRADIDALLAAQPWALN